MITNPPFRYKIKNPSYLSLKLKLKLKYVIYFNITLIVLSKLFVSRAIKEFKFTDFTFLNFSDKATCFHKKVYDKWALRTLKMNLLETDSIHLYTFLTKFIFKVIIKLINT